MAYLVLARKYRPRTFDEVVGQEVATRVLQGAIREGRIGHAYLLSGSRGTGKTTLARIFAKALNCEGGPTPDPCGACESCISIDAGNAPDFLEVDGASNRGIGDVRQIREQVAFAPMQARYKVYLIDEVHSVTRDGFNALLKTLEEPPPHVVFLFATTEPHKVIDTITSRCQVLELAAISEETIAAHIGDIAAREEMQPAAGVLEEIARRARGGLRDALSMLDQVRALAGDAPTLEDLGHLGGEATYREVDVLLTAVEEGDRAAVLTAVAEHEGRERTLLDALLLHVRGALVAGLCGADAPLLPSDESLRAGFVRRAKRLGPDRLQAFLAELVHARDRAKRLEGHVRVVLELCLLELCCEETTAPVAELADRLFALERGGGASGSPGGGPGGPAATGDGAGDPVPEVTRPPRAQPGSSSESEAGSAGSSPRAAGTSSAREAAGAARVASATAASPPRTAAETWTRFLAALAETHEGLAGVLRSRGKLEDLLADRAVVHLDRLRDDERLMVQDARNRAACSSVLSRVVGREVVVTLDDGSDVRPGHEDPFTSEVADLFGGTIDDRGVT